jgi:hypothetical protein
MAKNHIDDLSEETRKEMLEKAEQGTYPSFAPPRYISGDNGGKRYIQPDPIIEPLMRDGCGFRRYGSKEAYGS